MLLPKTRDADPGSSILLTLAINDNDHDTRLNTMTKLAILTLIHLFDLVAIGMIGVTLYAIWSELQ
jgi:hypothetical protein